MICQVVHTLGDSSDSAFIKRERDLQGDSSPESRRWSRKSEVELDEYSELLSMTVLDRKGIKFNEYG